MNTSLLWDLGILFSLLHAYPAASRGGAGMEFFRLSEEGWKEGRGRRGRLIEGFVAVNGWRLLVVDAPGWVCVVGGG
jgi:hypothetical protein